MAGDWLRGPWQLAVGNIDMAVSKTSPGAYALGHSDGSTFYISYVGRSDGNVNKRLKDHVGKYQHFKYEYFPSPKAAFDKECELFHAFGETALDNKVHPDRPENSGWKCPFCKN